MYRTVLNVGEQPSWAAHRRNLSRPTGRNWMPRFPKGAGPAA